MSSLALDMTKAAQDFLGALQAKQYKQVAKCIFGLCRDPKPHDYKHLTGHPGIFRVDAGEFRVCYRLDDREGWPVVEVVVVGRRNDDAAYRELDRKPVSKRGMA